jgi:hypothetical protein
MSPIIPKAILDSRTFQEVVRDLEHHLDLLDQSLARSEAKMDNMNVSLARRGATDEHDTPYSTDLETLENESDIDIMYVEPRCNFDEAIIGFDPWQSRLIYDEWLCVRIVMRTQYLDEEDAIEHCAANVFTMTTLPAGPIFSTLVRRRYN